jgi:hypothetical protein
MSDYLGTSVYVSFNGDKIGKEIERASLNNDADGLRKLSQGIEQGNELWGAWAVNSGGTIISLGGDEGTLEVPAAKLGELPGMQAQYRGATGCSCSVGVGLELSESVKALAYAKMHGGNRVCFYTPDVGEELEEAAEERAKGRQDPIGRIADEYLTKAEAPGPAQPQHETQSASGSQGMQARQQLGAAAAQRLDAPQAPPLPGESPAEQRLHAHAQKQKSQDGATLAVQQQQSGREAMRQQVVKVLKQVKAAAPLLEEAKAQSPEVYKAVLGAVQAMVAMAKQLTGGNSPESPDGSPDGEKGGSIAGGSADEAAAESGAGSPDGEMGKSEPLEKMALIHDSTTKPMTVYRVQNSNGEGPYESRASRGLGGAKMDAQHMDALTDLKVPADNQPLPRRDFSDDYSASKMVERKQGLYAFERPEHAEEWFGREGMRKLRMLGYEVQPVQAKMVHRSMTGKQVVFEPFNAPHNKAELPMPDPGPATHHLNLPVGSAKDGKVKVRHADGAVGWVEVRSGVVMSQDGHAISARNPGGR